MRKTPTKFLSSATAIPRPHCPYDNGRPHFPLCAPPRPAKLDPTTHFGSNLRWVFTNSLPPPEWVQPFADVSDLVTDPKHLQPSPWVNQILNLLDNSPNMERNLDTYCRKFLIKLSPSFVAFVLRSDQLHGQFDVALRLFYWAGKQKGYAHNIECFVSLFDVLSTSGDLSRIRVVFGEFKDKGFLMNVSAANSLIRSFGSLGMVEELLWMRWQMKENDIEPGFY